MFTINCHAQLYYPLIVSAWPINGWCRLRVAVWSRCPNTTAEIECFLLPIWCRKKNIIIDRDYPMGWYFSFHKVEKKTAVFNLLLMVMSPWRLSSRWLNLTTGSRAVLRVWTLCTPGTHFLKMTATSSKTSAGVAVDRSMSDKMESSERQSSDWFSPVCWKLAVFEILQIDRSK